MIAYPDAMAYQYPIENATEYHGYVHGNQPNYSPGNVTIYQGTIPYWIRPVSAPEPISKMPDEPDNPHLLLEAQTDIASDTQYIHYEFKVWNALDAQNLSNIELIFNPELQTLTIHDVKVWRNGTWIDKLDMSEIRVVQREEDLDHLCYCGDLSALLFLEDIREGDLIDYSYSIQYTHFLPFCCHYPLQFPQTWEKYCGRIVKAANRPMRVQINPPDFDGNFQESDLEYSWCIEPCPPYEKVLDLPRGYPSYASLEVTEFRDWSEVARLTASFFSLNPDFARDAEAIELVDGWKKSSSSLEETAIQATRFVQDEIRYLGLEDGVLGVQPTDPLATLKRRFGDCKGKTQLLRSFFAMLDLPSDPCLVNTNVAKSMKNHLPSLYFNHAILRLEFNGQSYFIDSTSNYNGGGLDQMSVPFGAGLILSDKTTDLIDIPAPIIHPEIECQTTYDVRPNTDIEMTIDIHFKGSKANFGRYALKKYGLNQLSEWFQKRISRQFDHFEEIAPLQLDDERDQNDLRATIKLLLKNPWETESTIWPGFITYFASFLTDYFDNKKSFTCRPLFLADYFCQDVDTDREFPLMLPDAHIRESVTIHGGTFLRAQETIKHKAFTFNAKTTSIDTIEFDLQTHLNALDPEDLSSFDNQLNEACKMLPIRVTQR